MQIRYFTQYHLMVFEIKNEKLNDIIIKFKYIYILGVIKMLKSPLISIVTVVLNDPVGLEKTIQSVINQEYQNKEYIIIDGGSREDTLKVIKKYEKYIDYWISEKDQGIYDAMNKGIYLSKGEWISFMNAGDIFVDNYVLTNIFQNVDLNGIDIIYGNTLVKDNITSYIEKSYENPSTILKKMIACHQSIFVQKKVYEKFKFDTTYKIAADYDFFLKCYLNDCKFKHIDIYVSEYDLDGFSNNNRIKTSKEYLRIVFRNNCNIKIKLYHLLKFFESVIKESSKSVLRFFLTKEKYELLVYKIRLNRQKRLEADK